MIVGINRLKQLRVELVTSTDVTRAVGGVVTKQAGVLSIEIAERIFDATDLIAAADGTTEWYAVTLAIDLEWLSAGDSRTRAASYS